MTVIHIALKGNRQYTTSAGDSAMSTLAILRKLVSPVFICSSCTHDTRRGEMTHPVAVTPVQTSSWVGTRDTNWATRTLHSIPDTGQGMNLSIAPMAPTCWTC